MPVVAGCVLDAGGSPVEHARVGFADAPVPLPDVAALTGADGSFALAAPTPGRYELFAATDEGGARVAVDVHGDDPVHVEITLEEERP